MIKKQFCVAVLALPGAYCILLQADNDDDNGGDGSADIEEWTLAARPWSAASEGSSGGQSNDWSWTESSNAPTIVPFSNRALASGNYISNDSTNYDLPKI